ncbi:hypothetical protein KFE80_01250 [bacterium SCSIO 12696]|nr:hypothetical protein KFE80_01250 [bacterium SCSIO 12696]
MKQFVAITDDMFYSNPQLFEQLVPFSHSIDCRHLLQQPLAARPENDLDDVLDVQVEVKSCRSH